MDELESGRCSFRMLRPLSSRKCFFGDASGAYKGSEKAECAGVAGEEKDIEFLPFDLP